MFVKIRYLKIRRDVGITSEHPYFTDLDREIIYDCQRVSIGAIPPEPPNQDVEEMDLIMDVGGQDERTIVFPVNVDDPKEEVEIYIMNNNGKTVERYIYK